MYGGVSLEARQSHLGRPAPGPYQAGGLGVLLQVLVGSHVRQVKSGPTSWPCCFRPGVTASLLLGLLAANRTRPFIFCSTVLGTRLGGWGSLEAQRACRRSPLPSPV